MVTKQSLLTTWITTEREREPELQLLLSDQRPASKCSAPPLQNFLDPPLVCVCVCVSYTSADVYVCLIDTAMDGVSR